MSTGLDEIWQGFRKELEARNERLVAELTGAWDDLNSLTSEVTKAFSGAENWQWEPGKLTSLQALFDDAAVPLLADPLARFHKMRPQQRVLAALDEYDTGLEDIVRRLPATVEVSGRELAEILGRDAGSWWRAKWLRLRGKPRPLPLRAVVRRRLYQRAMKQAKRRGAYCLLLAQASLALVDPWQIVREEGLRVLEGSGSDPKGFNRARQRWRRTRLKQHKMAKKLLAGLRGAAGSAVPDLAASLARAPRPGKKLREIHKPEKLTRYAAYWSRQRRAVSALLDLDLALARLGHDSIPVAQRTLDSLDAEHHDLLHELDSVSETLQAWQRGESNALPSATAQLISAEERLRQWAEAFFALARSAIPYTLETAEPKRALPGWRSPWRQIEPLQLFLSAVQGIGQRLTLAGLREAEDTHRAFVREIERAREVVTFALETAAAEGKASEQVAREGIANALSLILYQKQTAGEVRPVAEKSIVPGTAAVFSQCHVAIEQGRVGLLTHFGRQGGYHSLKVAWRFAVYYCRKALLWLWQIAKRVYHGGLVRIGWEPLPEERREHVRKRGYLGDSLSLSFSDRDLPMIYRRLFRLQPVEDPRFLVGREAELAALAEARRLWQNGRAVSVVVVGARGSGKTSLLNCALIQVFQDVEVVRSQFRERIRGPESMRCFLRDVLGISSGQDLREDLKSRQRVVILEEIERTYLRCVGGTAALRELLSLIDETCHTTLWILSLNFVAFKFLNAAVGMGQHFSHQINATSVEPEHLRNAILMRHNLSGLRLQFAAPANGKRSLRRLRRLAGLEEDAQQAFFDAHYRQCRGLFRAGFELWQRYIDRAEGGVLYMGRPVPPDYELLTAGLGLEDYFTLLAVLQHGSLTAEELAEVLDLSPDAAQARLERLIDREILEPEPEAPGWRVRPEGGHMVHAVLAGQNLL